MTETTPSPLAAKLRSALSSRGALLAVAATLLLVFVKNAWIDEDAYITFRVVEQLFDGNGLRWNPHERVQVFTHPLWLALLVLARVVTSDPFLAAIVVSLLCCAVALIALRHILPDDARFAAAGALLLGSRSIFDFTSSGLEQPLSFALLGLFMAVYLAGPDPRSAEAPNGSDAGAAAGQAGARWLGRLTLLFALLLLNRHDLATLALAPQLEALHRVRGAGVRRLSGPIFVGALPFVLWTLFSLFYYGLPVPNTALAKLNNGIDAAELWRHGIDYFAVTFAADPIVPLAAAGAIIATGLALARRDERAPAFAALLAGVALNTVYVMKIGGGHMLGRFSASAAFVSVAVACAAMPRPRALLAGAAGVLVVWTALQPSAPLRTGPDFAPRAKEVAHVLDERAIFFPYSSLYQWWTRDDAMPFPDHRWTHAGLRLRERGEKVVQKANVGFMGYAAGTDVTLVDPLALTDPLLSRLPSRKLYRIGHFPRVLPDGYLETLRTGEPRFADPAMQAYYDRIALVTQGDLFDTKRLTEIPRLLTDLSAPSGETPER